MLGLLQSSLYCNTCVSITYNQMKVLHEAIIQRVAAGALQLSVIVYLFISRFIIIDCCLILH